MKIKGIVSLETASVNPMNDANTYWYLYSLPSFDEGKQRECVLGSEIQSNKYIVPNKCILFNKLNVRFKRIWRVNDSDENKICSTEFLPLIVDEDIADFDYVYYLLNSERITSYLCGQNSNTSGSHKRIDPNNFLSIEVNLPSLEIQRNISSILASLDSKIENNTKINQNLCAS